MAERINKTLVDREQPTERERIIFDSDVPGFALKVTPAPAGTKSYLFQYRIGGRGGRMRRVNIGRHGEAGMTAEKARREAELLRGAVRDGRDPFAERQGAKAAMQAPAEKPATIADLVEEYLERWARPKKRSAAADERTLRKEVIPTWGKRAIGDVKRRDIVTLLDGIVDRGSPIQANRTLAVVRRMFNFGIERDLLDASPCVKVRAPADENQRDRNLSDAEITILWPALDRTPMEPNIRRALRFMLVTAQRKGEVIGLHEREINRKDSTWLIPAERAKNGRDHVVPLAPLALEIIDEAKADAIDGDEPGGWIFPSARTNAPYRDRSISHAVQDLFVARRGSKPAAPSPLAGIEPFTPHDLRRTAATKMRELGIARSDVSLVLNHVDRGVTGRHYDRYEGLREKRHALETWARMLETLIRPAPANVVPIARTA